MVRSARPEPPAVTRRSAPHLVIDLADESVWVGARKVPLAPKAFGVLRHLAEHRNRLVTKDDLLDAVWPGVFVGDAVLKVAVREVRLALDDDAREPQYIQTAHRRGYRFIGDVEIVDALSAQAVRPLRLVGAARSPEPAPLPPASAIVGREHPLAVLHERFARTTGGERHVVFVTGEPGIGKTALVDAFLDDLRRAPGVTIARGQCLELAGASEAYLPVLDAFGRLLRDPAERRAIETLRRYAPTWLMQMPSLVEPSERAALEAEVRGATHERMLREMAEAIEAMSADRPIVLVLEDLQWSDSSTVDLLGALARRSQEGRLLVIGTYRPSDLVIERHPLRAVKQDLQASRRASELPLELLDARAVSAFVDARLRPNGLPDEFDRLLHLRTDGNPLFLVAVLDYLVAGGQLRRNGDGAWLLDGPVDEIGIGVPDSLRVLVERQLERLDKADIALLEAASVAGVEFPSTAVAAALHVDEVIVEERCQQLVARGLFLVGRGAGTLPDRIVERFAFSHSLIQQVCYQRVPPARRSRLHLAIGLRGELIFGARASEIASELAVHFEQGRDLPRAIRYLQLAAATATRRTANQEAMRCLGRALELVEELEPSEQARVRIGLHEQLGLVLRSTGDVMVAAEQFQEMARIAAAAGRVDDEARAWLYAASVLSWFSRERCLRAADRAERLAVGDPTLRAHVRGYAAYARLIFEGWQAGDAGASARTLEAMREAGPLELFAFHLPRVVHVHGMRGDYATAMATARDGLALAGRAADTYDYLMCQFWRADACLKSGEWGEMQQVLDSATHMTERNGHRRMTLLMTLLRGWLHEEAGDHATALALCEPALEEARANGYPLGQLIGMVLLGLSSLGLGRIDRARIAFDEIATRLDRERLLMDWIWRMPLAWGRARVALALGQQNEAGAHAHTLLKLSQECGERTWLALAHAMLAEVAMASRRWKAADARLRSAMEVLAGGDAPLAAWRVNTTAARLHDLRGRRAEASRARLVARAVIDRLSASLLPQDDLAVAVARLAEADEVPVTSLRRTAARSRA
jgi:DNA-binding winged helix-turn-helix (wHTH) protein/tetratricopeptide (TPR) repeat protein